MKLSELTSTSIALLAIAGMLINGPLAMAAQPAISTPVAKVRDISLVEGGILHGQIVDAQGTMVPHAPISVRFAGQEIAATRTNQDGSFQIVGLRGGVHQLAAHGTTSTVRLWTATTTPPSAQSGLLVVANDNVVRGQVCSTCGDPSCGGCGGMYGGGAWATIGALALVAGIAVAIYAIADSDSGS